MISMRSFSWKEIDLDLYGLDFFATWGDLF